MWVKRLPGWPEARAARALGEHCLLAAPQVKAVAEMKLRRVTAWAFVGSCLTAAAPVFAQGTRAPLPAEPAPSTGATATPAPTSTPPGPAGSGIADVVRLKNGSMLRGTVIELIQGESVTLLLPSGQTRQFRLAEVEYAGPVVGAPLIGAGSNAAQTAPAPPASPAPAVVPDAPPVHLASDQPLNFGIQTATAEAALDGWRGNLRINHFDNLCTSPCDVRLPRGNYRFSITHDGKTISTAREVSVAPGDTVHGKYESFHGTRVAGVVIMAAGGGAGLIYSLSYQRSATHVCSSGSSFESCTSSDDDTSNMQQHLLVGLGVSLSSILIGGILALKHDEASVQVTPGLTLPRGGASVSDRPSASLLGAQGLTLSARF